MRLIQNKFISYYFSITKPQITIHLKKKVQKAMVFSNVDFLCCTNSEGTERATFAHFSYGFSKFENVKHYFLSHERFIRVLPRQLPTPNPHPQRIWIFKAWVALKFRHHYPSNYWKTLALNVSSVVSSVGPSQYLTAGHPFHKMGHCCFEISHSSNQNIPRIRPI